MIYKIAISEWGVKEYTAIFNSFFINYELKLKHWFTEKYQNSDVILLNSARGGLNLIVNRLKREFPDKNEVIVPSYICPSVIKTLEQSGLKIVSAEVGINLNICKASIEPLINKQTLAVLVVHMYGCPAEIDEIEQLCQSKHVILIDDAAQLGGISKGSRLLGEYGDFGIISFAQSKTIVTGVRGSGGVLLINKSRWKPLYNDLPHSLPRAKGRFAQLIHFLCAYQFSTQLGRLAYYWSRLMHKLNPDKIKTDYYSLSRISNLEAAIAYQQVKTIAQRSLKKSQIINHYFHCLKSCREVILPQVKGEGYLTLVIIEFSDGLSVQKIRKKMHEQGILTRSGYPGNKELIEIPCSSSMRYSDVEKISSTLIDCVCNIKNKA